MPKARAKTRGGATGTPAGPAPPRGRSAAATTMVSAAAEPRRRATSRRAPPRAPADPAWPVDHGQLRAIIQDVVREALDAAPANAAATSTSAAACADNYSPALPPTPLLAAGPAGMTYVTPEASGDDTSTVSTALRQRIHDGKYVELGLLLDAADKISEGNAASFQLVNGALRPISRPPRPILTFGAWCIAFSRFAGVYVEAHPGAAGGLLAHLRQVGQLTGSGLGLAWKEYDESFRRARETAPPSPSVGGPGHILGSMAAGGRPGDRWRCSAWPVCASPGVRRPISTVLRIQLPERLHLPPLPVPAPLQSVPRIPPSLPMLPELPAPRPRYRTAPGRLV